MIQFSCTCNIISFAGIFIDNAYPIFCIAGSAFNNNTNGVVICHFMVFIHNSRITINCSFYVDARRVLHNIVIAEINFYYTIIFTCIRMFLNCWIRKVLRLCFCFNGFCLKPCFLQSCSTLREYGSWYYG